MKLSKKEKDEFTSELNEMFLDQLMEEFAYDMNTLDDKIDFIEAMLHYYKDVKKMKGDK